MTSSGIRIRFTVEVIGDPSIVIEPDDLQSLDIENVTALIEDGLRLKITPDLSDLALLQLNQDAESADVEPHKPDLALLLKLGLTNLGVSPDQPQSS